MVCFLHHIFYQNWKCFIKSSKGMIFLNIYYFLKNICKIIKCPWVNYCSRDLNTPITKIMKIKVHPQLFLPVYKML